MDLQHAPVHTIHPPVAQAQSKRRYRPVYRGCPCPSEDQHTDRKRQPTKSCIVQSRFRWCLSAVTIGGALIQTLLMMIGEPAYDCSNQNWSVISLKDAVVTLTVELDPAHPCSIHTVGIPAALMHHRERSSPMRIRSRSKSRLQWAP